MAVDRLLLVNAMVGQFITGFATRSFIVGIPTIASALHADIVGISWAIVAYQLAGISLSVVFGRLGDLHGRRLIYGAGFGIMAASALACGLATSVTWLVLFRLVAGVGAAMLASATRVLALEAMPDDAAGKAHGLMTVAFHGGVLLGPPLGGLVIDLVSWRWVFLLLVPIGVLGVVLTALTAGRTEPTPSTRPAVDYVGAALLIVLTLLLEQRSASAIGAGRSGVIASVFAVALVGFVVHERRTRHPVVNLALFRIRMFAFSVLSLLIITTATSVMALLLPFYLQDVLHHSPAFTGVVFLFAPVFTIGLAPLVGRLADRIGPRIPTSIGVLMNTGALLVGMQLGPESHWLLPATLMALAGLGQGFFNPSNQMALIGAVPRGYRGFAAGMVQMVFGLGGLLGTALGSALLTTMFRYATGLQDATPDPRHAGPFVLAMNGTFAVCLGLTVIALAASLLRGPRTAASESPSS
ncbi:MAG TPA: MFS transporter [Candidatus Methylomirabilis sp.]|nr:MFS transporter [Candidatus Methylomirabilis sp.]